MYVCIIMYMMYVHIVAIVCVEMYLCKIVTDFVPSISLEPAVHTVGQRQEIICTAILIPGEDVNNSVLLTWVAPDGVNVSDERVTIMSTVVNGSNYTSVLHFDYLMETDSVGIYKCEIISNQSMIILPVDLQNLRGKLINTVNIIMIHTYNYIWLYTYIT